MARRPSQRTLAYRGARLEGARQGRVRARAASQRARASSSTSASASRTRRRTGATRTRTRTTTTRSCSSSTTRTVIDAGVDGNDARFFNHSCDPNCESVIENGRVYIETIRDIAAGRGADLRLPDPARGGRSGRHRRDIRLPLRGAAVPRHDAVAAPSAEPAKRPASKATAARKPWRARMPARSGHGRRSARQGKAVAAALTRPFTVCTRKRRWSLTAVIGATGIVYGDIGTSPLYAMSRCAQRRRAVRRARSCSGVLSLIFWALDPLGDHQVRHHHDARRQRRRGRHSRAVRAGPATPRCRERVDDRRRRCWRSRAPRSSSATR